MNLLQRQDLPGPTEPFSFSPPERPTTAMEINFGGPDEVEESPRRNVSPAKLKIDYRDYFNELLNQYWAF